MVIIIYKDYIKMKNTTCLDDCFPGDSTEKIAPIVIGPYRVTGEIQEGVYRAMDDRTGVRVVLKSEPWDLFEVDEESLRSGQAWRQLREDARNALMHEFDMNCRVAESKYVSKPITIGLRDRHDNVYAASLDAGINTLCEVAEMKDEPLILRSLAQLADALAHAHKKGIVHRDVKPSNVVVNGRTTLIDWASAFDINAKTYELEILPGTSGFMSPEQERLEIPTPQEDVFGFSVTAFYCLKRREPFFCCEDQEGNVECDFRNPNFRADALAEYGDFGQKVIQGLSYEPKNRPSIKELARSARKLYANLVQKRTGGRYMVCKAAPQ